MLLFFVNSEGGRQNIKASLYQKRRGVCGGGEKESGHESGMYDITMALAEGEH